MISSGRCKLSRPKMNRRSNLTLQLRAPRDRPGMTLSSRLKKTGLWHMRCNQSFQRKVARNQQDKLRMKMHLCSAFVFQAGKGSIYFCTVERCNQVLNLF